jgi:hypothetical protein
MMLFIEIGFGLVAASFVAVPVALAMFPNSKSTDRKML